MISKKYKLLFKPEADSYTDNGRVKKNKITKEDLPTDESYTLVCEGAGGRSNKLYHNITVSNLKVLD